MFNSELPLKLFVIMHYYFLTSCRISMKASKYHQGSINDTLTNLRD